MTDLKPCPFCGGKITKFTSPLKNTQMFVCHKCGADVCFYGAEYEPKASKSWNRRVETVKAQPAADVVEVRHGRWIEVHEFFKCSECGYLTDYRLSKFCPDCGAKMDGEVGAEK